MSGAQAARAAPLDVRSPKIIEEVMRWKTCQGKDNLTFSLVKLCVTGRVTRLVLVFLRFPVQPAPCQPPHRAFAGGSYSTACSAALSFEWKNAPTTSLNLG